MKGIKTHPALRAGGETYGGLETVLLLTGDRVFESRVREFAKSIGCKVYLSDRPFTDLIAVPCFIALVDRRMLGAEKWLELLEIRRNEFLYRDRILILDRTSWPVDRRCQRIGMDEFAKIESAIRRALMIDILSFQIRSLVPDCIGSQMSGIHHHRTVIARLFRRRLPRREAGQYPG